MLYAIELSMKGQPFFVKVGRTSNFVNRLAQYKTLWDVKVLGIAFGNKKEERFVINLLTHFAPPAKGREYFDNSSFCGAAKIFLNGYFFNYQALDTLWVQMEWDIGRLISSGNLEIAKKVSDAQSSCERLRYYFDPEDGGVFPSDIDEILKELHLYKELPIDDIAGEATP